MGVLTPLAVLISLAAVPAQARTDAGPVAYLTAGGPVADALHPVVSLPASALDAGLSVAATGLSAARGTASVTRTDDGQLAVAQLAKGAIQQADLDMVFSRLAAQCTTAPDGTVRGATEIAGGALRQATNGRAPALPVHPPVGFRLPGTRPDVIVTLNKQVRDPLGGLTVSAVSIDAAPGAPTAVQPHAFAVARCGSAVRTASALRNDAGQALTSSVGHVRDDVNGVVGGLANLPKQAELPVAAPGGLSGLFGGLPGLSRALPVQTLS